MIPNDSKDYYPTPPALAAELLAGLKIDGHSIEYAGGPILEPSAGSGDLARAIEKAAGCCYIGNKRASDYRANANNDILTRLQLDCIERSAALRATLKEAGFRVIHDDFLTFTPRAHYKAIIMNPPFSDGARHLLHALHIMERGGEVRCILNAETIRNPCTNERKELAALLNKYNARITYKQDAFTHAARKTAVEVALVAVTIPPAPPVSRIRLELNAETTQRYQAAPDLAALVSNDPITAAVERYNAAADGLARLYEEYDGISSLFTLPKKQGDSSAPAPCVSLNKGYNNALCDLRAIYWEQLFDLPQICDAMTRTMQNDYHERLNDLRHYDFTPYNILTVREEISRNIVSNIESEIIRLFDDWTNLHYNSEYSKNVHYYNGWCTNEAYKIGKRVIFRCNVYSYWSDKLRPTSAADDLANIEKTLHFLDTNGAAYNGDDLRAALKAAEASGQTTKIKLHYFTATFYKKGTCHIEFTYEPVQKSFLHPYQAVKVLCEGTEIGYFGKAAYDIQNELSMRASAYIMELDLKELSRWYGKKRTFQPISKFQEEKRDLAFVMDKNISCGDVENCIREANKYVKEIRLFDVYEGGQIPEGKKSMAFTVTFAPKEEAFDFEKVQKFVEKICKKLQNESNIELRG